MSSATYSGVTAAKSIVLVGFMGAGKSSVGRCLQKRTGLARFDTDEMVSSNLGLSIPEIFSEYGEDRFRAGESEALAGLSLSEPSIIVTGGGILLRKENVDLVKQLGTVVWLDADEETLFERASRKGHRPLLQSENPRDTFSALLRKRAPLYEEVADVRVDTSTIRHEAVADIVLEKMETFAASRS